MLCLLCGSGLGLKDAVDSDDMSSDSGHNTKKSKTENDIVMKQLM